MIASVVAHITYSFYYATRYATRYHNRIQLHASSKPIKNKAATTLKKSKADLAKEATAKTILIELEKNASKMKVKSTVSSTSTVQQSQSSALLPPVSSAIATKPSSSTMKKILTRDTITDMELISFLRKGHLYVPGLIDVELMDDFVTGIKSYESSKVAILKSFRHKVKVIIGRTDADSLSLKECKEILNDAGVTGTEFIPFMQYFNLWRNNCKKANEFACSSEIGKIAAELLGVNAVRLYGDSLFVKSKGMGPTLWHSDLAMTPFDGNDFITCWIPLQYIPSHEEGGSSLLFASASQRDFALPYWSEPTETDLSGRYEISSSKEFNLGDVSFHHGWTLHSAPPNTLDETRYAYAISFIADGMYLLQDSGHVREVDTEDYQCYSDWIDEVGMGNFARHKHLPIVYKEEDDGSDDAIGNDSDHDHEALVVSDLNLDY